MECYYTICIYCEDDHCLLKTVSLDEGGRCQECIQVSIPEKVLEQMKSAMRKRLENN